MKHLPMEDQITVQEFRERMRNMTDSQAQELGYPSHKVMMLSYKLSDTAATWRKIKGETLVYKYKYILYQMILNGFDPNDLDIQDQLPKELMPELPSRATIEAIQNTYRELSG